VPLDANEEEQFRRITAQLRDGDPRFGRTGWRPSGWSAAGSTVVNVLGLLGGLALLPIALATGWLPLGAVGYLVAVLAAVRLAEAHPWRARRRTEDADGTDAGSAGHPSAAWRSTGLARGLLAATGVAVVALAMAAPGPRVAADPDGSHASEVSSPAAEASATEASAAEQTPPAARRSPQRVATTTASP
jgi:hypothetical protein